MSAPWNSAVWQQAAQNYVDNFVYGKPNPFTGQVQQRQFSPIELEAMSRFGISPNDLATPEGQYDFATAVAQVTSDYAKQSASQFAPTSFAPVAVKDLTSNYTPQQQGNLVGFTNFVASNPQGRNLQPDGKGGFTSYQMTPQDQTLLYSTFQGMPSQQDQTNLANALVTNGIRASKGETFSQYVNRIQNTIAAQKAPGGFLQTDPFASF